MTSPAVGGFAIERDAVPIPGLQGGPLVGVAVGEHLHLFTGTPRASAQHVAVDADGAVAVEAHSIGVAPVLDASAFGEQILLVCAGEAGGTVQPQLVLADMSGTPQQIVGIPLAGELTHWPRVADVEGQVLLVWAESAGAAGNALWGARWASGAAAIEPTRLTAAPETVAGLGLASAGGDAVAAVYGPSGGLTVNRVRHGAVDATAALLADSRVTLARVYRRAHGWWVLALDDSGGGVQPLDAELRAVGDRLILPQPRTGEHVRDAMAVIGADHHTAFDVQFAAPVPGRVIDVRNTRLRRAHGHQIREVITRAETPGPITELATPGITYRTAAWLGERLIVVHGNDAPLVTVMSETTMSETTMSEATR